MTTTNPKMFNETTYISEIIEKSHESPVVIFKHSNSCLISRDIEKDILDWQNDKLITYPIYKVTVQTQPALSKKIEEVFKIKHESPQIIIINKEEVTYSRNHRNIKVDDFIFE